MVKQGSKDQSVCVNTTAEGGGGGGGAAEEEEDRLDWSGGDVSWVLSAFFWGYVIFQASHGIKHR